MKYFLLALLGLVVFAGLSCEGPMFSPADESDIRITIAEAERDGTISHDKAAGLLSLLDDLQAGYGWEYYLGSGLGLLGAFFGVRAQRQLQQRPRTLEDQQDVALLKQLLAERRASAPAPTTT